MADLFEEIDERLAIVVRYERWKRRLPWRLMPAYVRHRLFALIQRNRNG